jgi:hypothetical protein
MFQKFAFPAGNLQHSWVPWCLFKLYSVTEVEGPRKSVASSNWDAVDTPNNYFWKKSV